MSCWSEFVAAAPELAEFAVSRFKGKVAYLATIRPDGSPRVHPVVVHFEECELFVYMAAGSPKAADLQRDGRYSLHCGIEDTNGGNGEIAISGVARLVTEPARRSTLFTLAKTNGFNPLDSYLFFALNIDEARSTVYDMGQPQRTRWRSK